MKTYLEINALTGDTNLITGSAIEGPQYYRVYGDFSRLTEQELDMLFDLVGTFTPHMVADFRLILGDTPKSVLGPHGTHALVHIQNLVKLVTK